MTDWITTGIIAYVISTIVFGGCAWAIVRCGARSDQDDFGAVEGAFPADRFEKEIAHEHHHVAG